MLARFSISQPNRDDQSATLQLNAMPWACCDHIPIILHAERLKSCSDIHWFAPGNTIIVTTHGKASGVIDAIKQVDITSLAIDDCNGVVDSLFGFAIFLLGGISFEPNTSVSYFFLEFPGFAPIGGTAQMHFDFSPVGRVVFSCFTVRQDCALGGYNHSRYAVRANTLGVSSKHGVLF